MADPDRVRSDWTQAETAYLLRGVVRRGRRWSRIIEDFPGVFLKVDGNNRLPSTLRGKWDHIQEQQESLEDPQAICPLLQGVLVEPLGGLVIGPVVGGHGRLANWNAAETAALTNGVHIYGIDNWDAILNDDNLLFNEDREPFDLRDAWLEIMDFDAATTALDYLWLMLNAQQQAGAAQGNVQQAQVNGQAAAAVQQVQGAQVQAGAAQGNVQQAQVNGQAAAAVQQVQGAQVQAEAGQAAAAAAVQQVQGAQVQTVALLHGIALLGKRWTSIQRNPEFVQALNAKNTNQMRGKWSRLHTAQQPLNAGQLCRMLQGFPVDIIPVVPVPEAGVGSDAARQAALLLQWMRNAEVANAGGQEEVANAGGQEEVANAGGQEEVANAGGQEEVANAGGQEEVANAGGQEEQQQEVAIGKAPSIEHMDNAGDDLFN